MSRLALALAPVSLGFLSTSAQKKTVKQVQISAETIAQQPETKPYAIDLTPAPPSGRQPNLFGRMLSGTAITRFAGLITFLALDLGAHAPGFMLTSAPRTENKVMRQVYCCQGVWVYNDYGCTCGLKRTPVINP